MKSILFDSADKIHALAKIETLELREESLCDQYLHKTILSNCNKIISNSSKEQPKIDIEYEKIDKEKTKKKNRFRF